MDERWSRRAFLGSLGGACVTPLVLGACAGPGDEGEDAADAGADADVGPVGFTFDLHTHPGAFYTRGLPDYPGDGAFAARVEDMLAGGMSGAFVALVADMAILERTPTGIVPARAFEPGEAWSEYRRQLDALRSVTGAARARFATDVASADEARADGTVAALVAVEGGDFLEGDVERLGAAYDDGVRAIQLVHYAQNDVGDLQTEPAVYGGLSGFGEALVDAMVEAGMVIDVAHAAFSTVEAVAARTDVPIVLSHSLLETPEHSHPRHIDEDHARLVADTGGVIGLWPSGFGSETLDDFLDHTFRLIEVVGVDHVGLGTDMDGNYMPVIAGYADYRAWVTALGVRGLAAEDIAKVVGGNARRVLRAVL